MDLWKINIQSFWMFGVKGYLVQVVPKRMVHPLWPAAIIFSAHATKLYGITQNHWLSEMFKTLLTDLWPFALSLLRQQHKRHDVTWWNITRTFIQQNCRCIRNKMCPYNISLESMWIINHLNNQVILILLQMSLLFYKFQV